MEKAEAKKVFGGEAIAGAKKICRVFCTPPGSGNCRFAGGCEACAISKHKGEIEKNRNQASRGDISVDELFAICACCENTMVCQNQDSVEFVARNEAKCSGCPVHMLRKGCESA